MGFGQTAAVRASWRRSSEDAAITDFLKALLCSNTHKGAAIADFLPALLCSLPDRLWTAPLRIPQNRVRSQKNSPHRLHQEMILVP